MSHIAMLLPREELVYQAKNVAINYPDITEIRAIKTENTLEEADLSIANGASIIIARGIQALKIRNNFNVPVVMLRLTSQEIGLLIQKAKQILTSQRPKIAVIAASNMLADISYTSILFKVEMKVFTYDSEAEYETVNQQAIEWGAEMLIGGEKALEYAQSAGIEALFLDYTEDSIREAIRTAETALYAQEQVTRIKAQTDAILNTSNDGFIQMDMSKKIIRANEIMLDLLQLEEEDLVGKTIDSDFPGLDEGVMENVLESGSTYSSFLHLKNQAVIVLVVPIRLEDGRMEGALLSLHKVNKSFQQIEPMEDGLSLENSDSSFDLLHNSSSVMARAVNQAKIFSQSLSPVLLRGEPSLDYRLFAYSIHKNSSYQAGPFVQINCRSIENEDQLLVLFGTGKKDKDGEIDYGILGQANNGTLYMEEIDALTEITQYYLYQSLKAKRIVFHPLAQRAFVKVRLIASLVEKSGMQVTYPLRSELYYFLSGLQIKIPPLRERKEDLRSLVEDVFKTHSEAYGRFHVLTNSAWDLLVSFEWSGNLDQLNAFIERMVLTSSQRSIDEVFIQRLWEEMYPKEVGNKQEIPVIESLSPEAEKIVRTLESNQGNRHETAKALGISTTTLWRKMKKHNISDYFKIV